MWRSPVRYAALPHLVDRRVHRLDHGRLQRLGHVVDTTNRVAAWLRGSGGHMAASQLDPIDHIVVLMLENRSFDQMLGDFQRLYPTLDGIDPSAPRSETVDGHRYEQQPT